MSAAHKASDELVPAPDFVSRYFAPWVGIDEDPVTGISSLLFSFSIDHSSHLMITKDLRTLYWLLTGTR